MEIHRSQTLELEGSVIAIGAFDGIHKGHQEVVRQTVSKAAIFGVPSVIYTFDPPPRVYFQQAKQLLPQVKKIEKLRKLGVDHIVIATFDATYVNRTAESFICELQMMNPFQISVGEDFRFGYKRSGDINLLKQYFYVEPVLPVCCEKGERISSTRIRQLIAEGKLEQAIPFL